MCSCSCWACAEASLHRFSKTHSVSLFPALCSVTAGRWPEIATMGPLTRQTLADVRWVQSGLLTLTSTAQRVPSPPPSSGRRQLRRQLRAREGKLG